MVAHGLSASELMSATSLHNRERRLQMTAELLNQQQQQQHHYLGHREQVAKAMALASRNHPFSTMASEQQQHPPGGPRGDLILKRAISQLSAVSRRNPLQQEHDQRRHLLGHHHPAGASSSAAAALGLDNAHHSSPLCCAEPDLSHEKDICFGRGQRVQRRKANVAFRKIVATYQETYDQAVSREDKKAVVKKVARIFSRTGYRFFKESEDTALYRHNGSSSKMWIAVSDHDVEYKIGHSFRSGRKQIKQQQKHNQQRNQAKAGASGGTKAAAEDGGSSSAEAPAKGSSSSNYQHKKSSSRSMVASEANNNESDDDNGVIKEDELSDKCICIGDKRDKYTGMEAYQYFREFILTFKSIFGTSVSVDEKTKLVSRLIEEFKSNKGYRFLKLMSMKKDVEFWVEASADDIQSEVLFILDSSQMQPPPNKKMVGHHVTNDTRDTIEQENGPKKRQRLLPNTTSPEECARPSALKRIVTDQEPLRATTSRNMEDCKHATVSVASSLPSKNQPAVPIEPSATKGGLAAAASSSSVSSSTKPELPWKKGRKRALPNTTSSPTIPPKATRTLVPSEVICKRSATTGELIESNFKTGSTTKQSSDSISKADTEILSAIHRPGFGVPPSLSLPSALFGSMPLQLDRSSSSSLSRGVGGSHSLAVVAAASRAKMLSGREHRPPQQLPAFGIPSTTRSRGDTLGKALHAMRSSTTPSPPPTNHLAAATTTASTTSPPPLHHHRRGERSLIVEKAKQFEAVKHFEMRAKLLEHLKQQELLYIEKKHKLEMLDLQLQSPNSRM